MHRRDYVLVCFLMLILSGCAGMTARVDDNNRQYDGAHFRVTLPTGWIVRKKEDSILTFNDGPTLQPIQVKYLPHDEAFAKLERSSSPDMLPSELAELHIAELKASKDAGIYSLKVIKNEPVRISGRRAFSLHLSYKQESGLRYEMLVRGFVNGNGLYLLDYRAPSLHYFERDRSVFEALVQSFKTNPG